MSDSLYDLAIEVTFADGHTCRVDISEDSQSSSGAERFVLARTVRWREQLHSMLVEQGYFDDPDEEDLATQIDGWVEQIRNHEGDYVEAAEALAELARKELDR